MAHLILKRASANRPSGEWNDDDFDVLADATVVGRIMKVHAAPEGSPWMWTLAFGHHEDRTPTHGYEPTREGRDGGVREELARAKQTTLESKPERGRRSVEAGARRAAPHQRRGPRS